LKLGYSAIVQSLWQLPGVFAICRMLQNECKK